MIVGMMPCLQALAIAGSCGAILGFILVEIVAHAALLRT